MQAGNPMAVACWRFFSSKIVAVFCGLLLSFIANHLTRRSSGTRPEAGEPLNFTLELTGVTNAFQLALIDRITPSRKKNPRWPLVVVDVNGLREDRR